MEKLKRKQQHGFGSFGETEISILEGTIISSFFPEAEDMTIKEIRERVEYSYERVNSALKSLAEKKIIIGKQSGKTLVYSLDLKNLYAESMGFNAYMLQRKIEFIKKHKPVYEAIKKVVESPYVLGVILFGSYSKGTETKQSDVDLMCISNKEKETEHLVKSLKYESNVEFSPVVLPLHEIPNIKKDNSALWDDLKRYGIIFKGKSYFYYWMYKDEKN
ncbi:nucleotidyltransferase domain-containing protein [Candidatus Pacearchaeota archaeon]|nr:nucleotidyltransferase domain-containing protein [Candidatus Pacearchaeota archaeon]